VSGRDHFPLTLTLSPIGGEGKKHDNSINYTDICKFVVLELAVT
jgi:hypothetical protein